jgi:signal transduction histidine kinase
VDVRSDIFSFGSVLYEMVTGTKAFQSDSRMSTVAAILREDPTPARQIAKNLPPELERIVRKDPGIGMDETELRSIFTKFYRTKKAEASGEAGTGIGLSIVEQIVTHHGGRVEVTSKPGAGSCFTIVLPVPVSAAAVPAK